MTLEGDIIAEALGALTFAGMAYVAGAPVIGLTILGALLCALILALAIGV